MKEEQHQFLTVLGHPPARLSVDQVAWTLGCQVHDIPILVAARLIKPLGNPAPNAIKFFATAEILEQVKDRSWLAKLTNTVNQAWQKKNAKQKNRHAYTNVKSPELPLPQSINHVLQAPATKIDHS